YPRLYLLCCSGRRLTQLVEAREENATSALPSLPFLVVIIIAPAAALEPYNAAAAGPFKMDMFSTSSGLTSMIRLLLVEETDCAPSKPLFPPNTVELDRKSTRLNS